MCIRDRCAGLFVFEDLFRDLPNVGVHRAVMHHRHFMGSGVREDDLFRARKHSHSRWGTTHGEVQNLANTGDLVSVCIADAAALHPFTDPGDHRYGQAAGHHAGEESEYQFHNQSHPYKESPRSISSLGIVRSTQLPGRLLLSALGSHGSGAGSSSFRIQVRAARVHNRTVLGDLVNQRDTGRNIEAGNLLIGDLV